MVDGPIRNYSGPERRKNRPGYAACMAAIRAGRYPTVWEFAAMQRESGVDKDQAQADLLGYKRALDALPRDAVPFADSAADDLLSALRSFKLDVH